MNNQIKYIDQAINNIENKITEARELLQEEALIELANAEIKKLEAEKQVLEDSKNSIVNGISGETLNEGEVIRNSAIIEIRAGAGGDEAGLFANEIYQTYLKYFEKSKWKTEPISKNVGSGIGNIKEVIFQVDGKKAYNKLQFETGVHRVQRVPETEKSGRVHTSTITVAVLPIVEAVELEIKPEDIKIDTFRASGAGGQHVNKTDSAIRITYLPTNTVVECQDSRSQHKNREMAMNTLRSRLFEAMQRAQKNSIDEIRADQIGTGDRSEKIRTFNFPQARITDHRINKSWHDLNKFFSGDIDDILTEVYKEMQLKNQIEKVN